MSEKKIEVRRLERWDEGLAREMGRLLRDLTPKYDGGAMSQEWVEMIVESELHDQLLVFDGEELIGMATVSVVLGAYVGRNVYLEDCVVKGDRQGQGVGGILWEAVVAWGREKGARRLEFTSTGGDKKTGAVGFYLKQGAEIRETNFFRFELL
ncbi:GNAT family N-acetyltransferase [Candidatus Saccharibacteria bacterium]|nr:GNAT family N-acetyltransferase [Candidatus Saccharibacteria bacterium]